MSNSAPADRIPARTDAEAKTRFLRFLNLSLTTLSSEAIWVVSPSGELRAAVTVPPILRLRTSDSSLYLRSTIQFTCEDDDLHPGERKVSTHHYAHTLGPSETFDTQLYSWEWAAADPTYPHVHLRRSDPEFHGLGKLHIPTGRVFFEDVARFLIEEHGVQPARDDWHEVLLDTHRRVSRHARWGAGSRPTPPG